MSHQADGRAGRIPGPPETRGRPARSSFIADLQAVLGERDFRKLFATRLVSQTGDGVFNAGLGAYVRLEGRSFGDTPLNLEYKLEVWDSPNSAGVIIDAVRAAKIAKDRGIGGPLISPSSYFMKSPPQQFSDDDARDSVDRFITGEVER